MAKNNFLFSGIQLIQEFEGCALVAYQDQRGVWTIGYGSTRNVVENQVCTADEALAMLRSDIAETELRVQNLVKWPISDTQYTAIVCFTFNVGSGNLSQSTLLRCVNTGHLTDAAQEFLKWDKVNGVPNDGLLRRRQAERALYLA